MQILGKKHILLPTIIGDGIVIRCGLYSFTRGFHRIDTAYLVGQACLEKQDTLCPVCGNGFAQFSDIGDHDMA